MMVIIIFAVLIITIFEGYSGLALQLVLGFDLLYVPRDHE